MNLPLELSSPENRTIMFEEGINEAVVDDVVYGLIRFAPSYDDETAALLHGSTAVRSDAVRKLRKIKRRLLLNVVQPSMSGAPLVQEQEPRPVSPTYSVKLVLATPPSMKDTYDIHKLDDIVTYSPTAVVEEIESILIPAL